jgi:hypothetical protein
MTKSIRKLVKKVRRKKPVTMVPEPTKDSFLDVRFYGGSQERADVILGGQVIRDCYIQSMSQARKLDPIYSLRCLEVVGFYNGGLTTKMSFIAPGGAKVTLTVEER